jgi:hypothetical protein
MEREMKDFRAVSIISRAPSCEAARSPAGQRRLLTQGVSLPLSDCSMPELCKCRYQKHADRRTEENRRMLGSTLRGVMFGIKERRSGNVEGRRQGDR